MPCAGRLLYSSKVGVKREHYNSPLCEGSLEYVLERFEIWEAYLYPSLILSFGHPSPDSGEGLDL